MSLSKKKSKETVIHKLDSSSKKEVEMVIEKLRNLSTDPYNDNFQERTKKISKTKRLSI